MLHHPVYSDQHICIMQWENRDWIFVLAPGNVEWCYRCESIQCNRQKARSWLTREGGRHGNFGAGKIKLKDRIPLNRTGFRKTILWCDFSVKWCWDWEGCKQQASVIFLEQGQPNLALVLNLAYSFLWLAYKIVVFTFLNDWKKWKEAKYFVALKLYEI